MKYLIGYYAEWEFVEVASYSNANLGLSRTDFLVSCENLRAAINKAAPDLRIIILHA